MRQRLFAHMQRLPLSFHSRSSTGDLLSRLTGDINMMRDLMASTLLTIVSEGLLLVGFLTVMFLIDWRAALIAALAIPVIFRSVLVYSSRIRNATRKQRRREGELAGRLHEALCRHPCRAGVRARGRGGRAAPRAQREELPERAACDAPRGEAEPRGRDLDRRGDCGRPLVRRDTGHRRAG